MPQPNEISNIAIRFNSSSASGRWSRIYRYISLKILRMVNTEADPFIAKQKIVLDRLLEKNLNIFFDIGSADGHFINACIERFPSAKIHSFETNPVACKMLERAFPANLVCVYQLALSSKTGLRLLEYVPNNDKTSSLIHGRPIEHGKPQKTIIKETTGDEFCEINNIVSIDLLNLNVDNYTDSILKGFSKNLTAGGISVITLNCHLRDEKDYLNLRLVSDTLKSFSFIISRVTEEGFSFDRPFDFLNPTEFFHNFVAIRQSKKEIIAAMMR